MSEVRVARIDGEFIVNPLKSELEKSDMEIMIAGTMKDVVMIEGETGGNPLDRCREDLRIRFERGADRPREGQHHDESEDNQHDVIERFPQDHPRLYPAAPAHS